MSPPIANLTHRIRRVIFDLNYPDESAAFQTRLALQANFSRALLPVLTQVFDQVAGDRVYYLERVEIDVGRISDSQYFAGEGLPELREHLETQLLAVPLSANSAITGRLASQPGLALSLTTFLTTGSWPWHAPYTQVADVEAAVLGVSPAQAQELAGQLRPLLTRETVRRRLVNQFSPAFLRWLLLSLAPAGSTPTNTPTTINDSIDHTLKQHPAPAGWLRLLRAAGDSQGQPLTHRPQTTPTHSVNEPVADLPPHPPPEATDVAPLSQAELAEAMPVESVVEPVEMMSETDLQYVLHAGIIILHPFLEYFFRNLGLEEDGHALATHTQRERAVHLLYHLATGETRPEEAQTQLLKLLCGLPFDYPLVRDLPLSPAETAEATQMLTAVIRHWDKLKNTSPAALQTTFFQREGRLQPIRDGWRLTVEQRGVDVLLPALPWSIALIRLPWMADPLWVDWT